MIGALAAVAYAVQFLANLFQPHRGYFWMHDSPFYWGNAQALASSGRVKEPFYPMGASVFLAPFAGADIDPFSVVLWVHPALHALNVLLAYLMVRSFAPAAAAITAGLAVCFYPPLINYARQLMSEPWFVTCLLASLAILSRKGAMTSFIAGVFLGLAVLVRTPGLGILAAMPFAMLAIHRSKREAIAYICGGAIPICIGVCIASLSAERLVWLTSGTAMTTSCRSVWGGYRFLSPDEQPASYVAHLVTHPKDFLWERWCAFLNIVTPWPLDQSRQQTTKLIIFASDAPILVASVWSVGRWMKQRRDTYALLLLVPALGLIVFYTLLFAINRYRMPYMVPLICLCAGSLLPGTVRATRHGCKSGGGSAGRLD